ncbi:alanyl-tRNA editing protein [Dryocola sp. BD586]|uniref:alanyl-tRNA editing protein n=1 Tax=Dryocola sp. BD586 TaxID=3133271 RepID=UPI003F4FDF3A
MTERLYYTSDETEGHARVTRCIAEPDGRYAVELDKTLFHPQGGGQPADKGWIAGLSVEEVAQRGESVVHILPQPLEPGEVDLLVNAATRMLHSRWHSAGHLIGYAGEQYGWRPVKAHHWPGEGRITFAAGEYAAVPDAAAVTEKIERWQTDRLIRHIEFEDGRRKVRFGELPAYMCGGTHVGSLSEIGSLEITGIKVKKGQLIVNYAIK